YLQASAKYISQCIDEIKQELKQDNIAVKANAVCKLTYLQMLGYDISWAAFNIIEVMSASKFTFKRIGYLAASQCFHEGTDVIMLTTNQIRKDLSSPSQYDTGVALTGLSCFVTPDLARDLANDIMTLMSHTKPYIRKKAVLIMYKVFLKYPESLRPAFPRLKEKLEDPDPGVQSAAVNVICELARRNPKNYLSLAPLFFKLMTSSTNNWVLIKIIKLFGALTPLEPRLGKKLIEPLTNLIHSTSAMSLLYECVNTVILCVQKLRILIEDSDQNCEFLSVPAPGACVALGLSIPHDSPVGLARAPACSIDMLYQGFWPVTRPGARTGASGASEGPGALAPPFQVLSVWPGAWGWGSAHVTPVAGRPAHRALLVRRHLQEPQQTLEAMLRPKVTTLPGHIQAVYVQNVVKLYASILQQKEQAAEPEAAQDVTQLMVERLPQFVQSADLEVQERASCVLQLVKHIQKLQAKDVPVAEEVSALFAGELNPVAPKAQKKVPVPEGLDLDAWINEPPSDSESEDEKPKAIFHDEEQRHAKQRQPEAEEEELARRREARKQEQANNPFYIKSSPSPQKRYQDMPGVEHIPVVQIDLSVPLKVPGKYLHRRGVKAKRDRETQTLKQAPGSQLAAQSPTRGSNSRTASPAAPEGSSVHDGVPVPFQLPPGISNEAQFVFTIQSIVMAQKLKGTLSFIAKNDEGSTHEKLDFKLHFSCTSYLVTTPCYSDAFAKLLESGDLSMSSIKVDGISMSFQNLLAKICFHHHFSGKASDVAGRWGGFTRGEKSVSVDGKCSDATLLSNLLAEMKATLAEC
uniref:Adaptor related protein complex 3 subunit delta 1 n=1 Tax=Panthera tigris altaica TaxID=74533 RepID=A0A8C9KMZ8_PANTA